MQQPSPTPTLSVILITRNESRNIVGCLQSVAFADEWIVVDANSSDDTAALALAFGATVEVTPDWPGFGAQKNRALALARGRWVLSIDADERVSEALAAAIQRAVVDAKGAHEHDAPVAFELARRSSFCGAWIRYGDWRSDRVTRLFLRSQARFSDDLVHERVVATGKVARLEGYLLHDTMPTLDGALDKMNRYSSGRAVDALQSGKRSSFAGALAHGAWAFLRSYVLKLGFLDGKLGFVLAAYIAEGTYYRHLKIWLGPEPQTNRTFP